MTLGKDVSALFPDIIKNMATSDLDQKKLVYLYLMLVFGMVGLAGLWLSGPGTTQRHTQTCAFLL